MSNREKIQRITLIGILAALTVVLSFIPVKYFFEITLTIVPIVVGILVGGKRTGLILGAVFGIVSFLQCFGFSPLGVNLLAINPFLTFIVCVPTRMLMGWLAGFVYELSTKKHGHTRIADIVCSILVPLLNTIFFMFTMVACFYNTELIQGFKDILGAKNVIHFIILFVGINGLIEMALGVLTGVSMTRVVDTIKK